MESKWIVGGAWAVLLLGSVSSKPALAAEPEAPIAKCAVPYGTVAITDGDAQGWTKFGLSSPRALLGHIIAQSGCFTLHDPSSGQPADYLISANVGSREEIDASTNAAVGVGKTAVTEGLVRSGVAARVPFAGAALGMLGGLGGKKKTVSAGLKVISPATGTTLIAASGETSKSMVKLMSRSEWLRAADGSTGGYAGSKDGQMLTGAFVQAYNGLVGQAGTLPPRRAEQAIQ